jgi:hypothetical protein
MTFDLAFGWQLWLQIEFYPRSGIRVAPSSAERGRFKRLVKNK